MEILNARELDPMILIGIVNEKLRHGSNNLADLAAEMELDSLQLEQQLLDLGYQYQHDTNQFIRCS
ncbi:DUF4250 family protein [Ferrimonas lipolytica]|uniref:DUF4250 domain-containing protein n=1 Tax=Ferrimonas lipolytica TaxID=2724191 RepID=A0A6H1UI16_9GAMM|nr:DUF4250 family protein [Ferrimonas lipolytica]QIZ77432.1 DUF4250 domain-containing protein [Ferrimonas lipolytica]